MARLTEAKLRRLVLDVADIDRHEPARDKRKPLPQRVNRCEGEFLNALAVRGKGARVLRQGWPDFLVCEAGAWFAVEVKRRSDVISHSQLEMFEALSTLGLTIYVWCNARPDRLVPWRKWPTATARVKPRRPKWAEQWSTSEAAKLGVRRDKQERLRTKSTQQANACQASKTLSGTEA